MTKVWPTKKLELLEAAVEGCLVGIFLCLLAFPRARLCMWEAGLAVGLVSWSIPMRLLSLIVCVIMIISHFRSRIHAGDCCNKTAILTFFSCDFYKISGIFLPVCLGWWFSHPSRPSMGIWLIGATGARPELKWHTRAHTHLMYVDSKSVVCKEWYK